MIKGTATVKKPIKYLGDDKFEITLTDLTTNDMAELLATNGTRVAYNFNGAMDYRGEVREEPQNEKLYNVVNGVVQDVRPADPESAADIEELIGDGDEDGCSCSSCVHLVDWPDDNDPEKTVKACEIGMDEDGATICEHYQPIIDIGAEDGEPEQDLTPVDYPQEEETEEKIDLDESAERAEPEPEPQAMPESYPQEEISAADNDA